MTVQEKLAGLNTLLDLISQMKRIETMIGFMPQLILDHQAILEALILKELKDLEIE